MRVCKTAFNLSLVLLSALLILYYLIFPFVLPSYIYFPSKDWIQSPQAIQSIYLKSKDKTLINAWYIKAKANKPTILFCHGNAGNISYYQEVIDTFSSKGYGLLLVDYRGYGKSQGAPSESGLYKDVNTALRFLKEKEKIPNRNIVIWGWSLGGAVVTEAASHEKYKAVILQSTFTNIKDEALYVFQQQSQSSISRAIIRFLVDNLIYYTKFDTKSKVVKIESPLLIAHDMPDTVIPARMSYELAKLNPKAELFISKEGSHNEGRWVYPTIIEFIERN